MARYADAAKEQVRDAVDFERLVGAHTDLRRAGPARLTGLCPFHDERTPSFSVDPVKKVFFCFGCGAAGDVYEFVMRTENVGFPEALELLADRTGVTLEREDEDPAAAERRRVRERLLELLERSTAYYERALWESEEARPARAHLAERGLEEATARRFRVGYAPSAWDRILTASRRAGFTPAELLGSGLAQRSSREQGRILDRFRRRLMFPLADGRGRVIGFGARALGADQQPKYLNSPEGPVYHKGRQLFGLHLARPAAARNRSVLLVEGYTDVLALNQAGIEHVVAAMGTALTEEQIAELRRLVGSGGSSAQRGTVRLCLDADAAGEQAMVRTAALAARQGVALEVVPLPQGSDPAELVLGDGTAAISELIAGAIPFARFRVDRVLDGADLGTAAGRDHALAELAATIGVLAPGALREELLRTVADRLSLSPELVASIVARAKEGADAGAVGDGVGAGARAGRRAPGPRPMSGAVLGREVLGRREETERAFLAFCVAVPDAGREALSKVSVERHFVSPLVRRAAVHLRGHLHNPLADLPNEDPDLARLMAELVVRAGDQGMTEAGLQVELLQLERARLEREIAAAQTAGLLVGELAAERSKVNDELDRAVERAGEAGAE
ncbi:MAG: DNA primase [Solirubrobacterales bacterium]|nr:MAG: DNA primase [Solirubrobacterales bacterium]